MREVEAREREFWDARARGSCGEVRYFGDLVNTDDGKLISLHRYALDLLGPLGGKRILDCGCGYGALSCHLAKRGAKVVAVDISQESLDQAKRWFAQNGVAERIETKIVSLSALPFEDGTFDFVTGSCILHHLDLDLAAPELRRVLKPGGKAVFVENNAKSSVLMFFRNRVLAPLGLRRGSTDESPMDEAKVAALRASFPGLKLHFPELVFLRLGASFFKDQAHIRTALETLDTWLLRVFPALGSSSYFDVIELPKDLP